MIDVLVEGNGSLNEEIGPALNEDMIGSIFPFSPVIPASLEARNKLLLEDDENVNGIYFLYIFNDLILNKIDKASPCVSTEKANCT